MTTGKFEPESLERTEPDKVTGVATSDPRNTEAASGADASCGILDAGAVEPGSEATVGARKPMLDLPAKIILSPRGVTFFVRNRKKLNRFRASGNAAEYGLYLNQFAPASLQRMIILDYVARIEISSVDFAPMQRDLYDLGKLIVYSLLYHQFDAKVHDQIFSSDLIIRWNRRHIRRPIDRNTSVNDTFVRSLLAKQPGLVREIRDAILEPIRNAIGGNPDLEPREKTAQLFTAEKFISNLRPFHWFLLAEFRAGEEFQDFVQALRDSLVAARSRTAIAEYLALVTQEMLTNAVNISLQDYARDRQGGAWDPSRVLHDRAMRERLMADLASRQQQITAAWTLGGKGSTAWPGLNNLRISIQTSSPERVVLATDRASAEGRRTIRTYYERIPESVTNTELFLYYYNYLVDACRSRNVRVDSVVHDGSRDPGTTLSLALQF